MQWLANICVRRPILASVLIAVLLVVGLVGYKSLGVDKFPKIDFPVITIITPYPGSSPLAVESDVTQKIEEAVNTVSGLDTLTSTSTEGVSLVIAQFDLDVDIQRAENDINEHIAGVLRDLPPGLRPEAKKADPDAAPIAVLSVKGPVGKKNSELTRFADKSVKQRLERLPGVGEIIILGGQKRQININLDPIRLAASGVSALEVQGAIAKGNVNVPGGAIETGPVNTTLRIEGRAVDPLQIGNIVVRQSGVNPIRVRDVAEVEDGEEDAYRSALRNGQPAIALQVRKQSGTNTVAVVDALKKGVAELSKNLQDGWTVDFVRDNSIQIRTSADQVLEHLILGAGLAALIVLLFLGSVRSTVIAAISIPVSIIATFGLMMIAHFTLNLMTLLALALAVGIVIDDAIVVLENIYRYIDEKRMKPFPAAIAATKEIGMAVLATTLSLMAVFLPVAFMSGIVGRFMYAFGMTMAFAIAVSMVVAFTLTPMMAARMLPLPPPEGQERKKAFLERVSDRLYRPIVRLYSAVLAFCLRRRWVVGLAIIGSCGSMAVTAKRLGGDFLPPNDEAQFEIYLQAPEGTSLEQTTMIGRSIARETQKVTGVESTLVTVANGDQRQSNVGSIYVHLVDPDQRALGQFEIMNEVREKVMPKVPSWMRVAVQQVNDFNLGGQNAAVSYVISGPDLDALERYGHTIRDKMIGTKDPKTGKQLTQGVPGVVDFDTSLLDPVDETTLTPDLDRAAALGVDAGDITSSLSILIGGTQASTFEDRGDQYAVWLRAAEKYRSNPDALQLIAVPSRTLGQVPLSDVVTRGETKATSKVTRQSRERAVTITMNVAPGFSESSIVTEADKAIKSLDMPAGYTAEPFGRSKEMAKLGPAFIFAILMSFVFMYLVLAAQFESLLYPLIIMLALPLTFPFALMSLVITGGSLNIFSMLGIIVLFGMVKKNAILQVDHANGLREQGLPRTEAVLAASRDRLRPILMTTFAFVAGMIPLITSQGIGSGFSKAIASVVVGGQTLSLLLTLIAIPVIYTWFDDLARGWRGLMRKIRRGEPPDRGAGEVGVVDMYAASKRH